ncbi:hypothetical protein BHUM_04261c [Candidatus Burkholderia humilis]|nr:hypothetical protein BHUM_04261c [Candidatus Burkholderia humilis]
MARPKQISASPASGAGTVFALRAIGMVLAVRWAFSMSEMGYLYSLRAMTSSPWACINLVLIFLLVVQPGAKPRTERPLHPLPQWLRQALRFLAPLAFAFALFSVGTFVWVSGWKRFVHALADTNGWLLVGPALYAVVMWICRPRALWRTNVVARRFSIGRYAISLDPVSRTAVVWAESRKLGQYDARELSVKWPQPPEDVPSTNMLAPATEPPTPAVRASGEVRRGMFARRPKVELQWNSPAAGHNRHTVFRAPIASIGDRNAAKALDSTLRQI